MMQISISDRKTTILLTFLLFSLPLMGFSQTLHIAQGEAIWIPKKFPSSRNSQNTRTVDENKQRRNSEHSRYSDKEWEYKSKSHQRNKQHWENYRRNDNANSNYRERDPRWQQDYRGRHDELRHNHMIEKRVVIEPRHHNQPNYNIYRPEKYIYYRTPWYNTRYIAPIPRPYFRIGHRVNTLPFSYVELMVSGSPYYYDSGVYYKRNLNGGYLVVSAPIGARVRSLPVGFIAFSLGLATYYYVNDTYYTWDEPRSTYVVIKKPNGATDAMDTETLGRLFAYPNIEQSEEQQAKDRYECHQWAVNETGHDPSLPNDELTNQDRQNYRRAISACLVGRNYTVK